jgi:uncharacterized protein with GYD domain
MYFAFGKSDAIVIVDIPDPASMAAAALAISASGSVTSRTTVLLTAADVDAAARKTPAYTPPGR